MASSRDSDNRFIPGALVFGSVMVSLCVFMLGAGNASSAAAADAPTEATPVTPTGRYTATKSEIIESTDKETIIIRADRAWEEPDGADVLHFAGNFELISSEWTLTADEADLYGPIDDPDRIVARGNPARVKIVGDEEEVIGLGSTIEYLQESDVLILTDNARLEGEQVSMSSSKIEYDVAAKRLKSSGTSGVEMILQRDKQ